MDNPQESPPAFQARFGSTPARPDPRQVPRSRLVIDPDVATVVCKMFRLVEEGCDPETIADLIDGNGDGRNRAMKSLTPP
jgi:hypothetical protein